TLNLGAQDADVRAVSFNLSGTLYLVNNDRNTGDQLDDFLFSLAMEDFATGNATLVGQITLADQTALKGVQGMAASPLGTFFAWDVFLGLVSIDPASGIATDIDPNDNFVASAPPEEQNDPGGINPGSIQSLAFVGGTLFGARNDLFEIDTSSGQATLVGAIGGEGDIRGLSIVPEPSTWALLSLGLLALVVARRRQRA
ncbi:MAG: PEP-CTERM sorting domain-containing protein, partial [Myxococcota bacterium]